MTKRYVFAAALLAMFGAHAEAQGQFTRQQQEAACSDDAFALCGDAVPDEARVRACMVAKRRQLSERCRTVFEGSQSAPRR